MDSEQLLRKAIHIQYEQGNKSPTGMTDTLDFLRGDMSDIDLQNMIKTEIEEIEKKEEPKYTLTDNQRDEIKGVILKNEKKGFILNFLNKFPILKKVSSKYQKENISPEQLVILVNKLGYKKEALQQALNDPAVSKTRTAKTIKRNFPSLRGGKFRRRTVRKRSR